MEGKVFITQPTSGDISLTLILSFVHHSNITFLWMGVGKQLAHYLQAILDVIGTSR